MKNLTILLFLILLVGCKSECTEAPVEEVLPAEVQETLIEEVEAVEELKEVLLEVETIEEVVPEILEPETTPIEEVPAGEILQ
tara:strand:- start:43 stop:291 length:249 start_codon:yes stop_codon:yes gene_type:complete